MAEIVDIVIEDEGWRELDLGALAGRAARATLHHLGLPETCEVSLLAAGDARIAALNAEFRERQAATNVLSWPAEELRARHPGAMPAKPRADFPGAPPFLGDLALALETCVAEAEAGGKPLPDHVTHLIVHGILHLLGYDHDREADAALMERIEVEILAELGVPDPYGA